MNKHWTSAGLGLMLVGAAGMAFAQPPGGRGPQGDRSPLKQVIEKADTDGDGSVSYADITAALPGFPEHAFDRIDGDGNGAITQQEIDAHRDARKERMGGRAHGERPPRGPEDGHVHFGGPRPDDHRPEGFRGQRGPRGPEDGHRFGGPGAEHRPEEFRGPRGPGDPREHMAKLRAADVNQDHQISAEEFAKACPEAPADRFQRMDRNSDGVLTPDDRPEGNGPPPHFRRHLIDDADTSGDEKISFEELSTAKPGFPRETFQQLDRNGDGVVCSEDGPSGSPHGRGGPRGHRPGPPPRN